MQTSRIDATSATLVLGLMTLVNTVNFLDRMLFSILQEPIKHDLALTDFELGLLSGPAFAVLYSLLALPLGRLADRRSRVGVVAIVTAVWSMMTAFCGAAGSFTQLLFARLGVSVGEAGCAPAAHSLIADFFPRNRRAGAIAVFTSGSSIGTLAAAFAGAALATAHGWRVAFFVCGAIGLVLAAVLPRLLRDPPRVPEPGSSAPSLLAAARILYARPAFRHLSAAMSLGTLSGFAITQYLTSFLIRAHHMPLTGAASVTGLLKGAAAFFTTLAMGFLIDRLKPRMPLAGTRLPAIGLTISAIAYSGAFLAPTLMLALPLLTVAVIAMHGYLGAGFAAAQEIAPPAMRSTASGLLMLMVGLIGYAIGAPLVGLVSDIVAGRMLVGTGLTLHGCAAAVNDARCLAAETAGIRAGLLTLVIPLLWSALHFWLAGRTMLADAAAARPRERTASPLVTDVA